MWKKWKIRALHIVTVWLTKNLLRAVHEDELLVFTNRGWYIGKRLLKPEEVSILREDAKNFSESFLWRMMKREVKFMAYMRATNKARSSEDLIYSGAMYYNLELLEKFLKQSKEL